MFWGLCHFEQSNAVLFERAENPSLTFTLEVVLWGQDYRKYAVPTKLCGNTCSEEHSCEHLFRQRSMGTAILMKVHEKGTHFPTKVLGNVGDYCLQQHKMAPKWLSFDKVV